MKLEPEDRPEAYERFRRLSTVIGFFAGMMFATAVSAAWYHSWIVFAIAIIPPLVVAGTELKWYMIRKHV